MCTFDKDVQDEKCFLLESMKELKVFKPNQIALVKKLLENAKNAKQNHHPNKSAMHVEKEGPQSEVNSWVTTLIH
jgi:homospermidine synthase